MVRWSLVEEQWKEIKHRLPACGELEPLNWPISNTPSRVERANERVNVLFGTVDVLFGTADSGCTGKEDGKEDFAPPDAPAAVDS